MVIYLDTNVLLTYIKYNQRDSDFHQTLRKILYNQKVRIPQIVVGEAMAVIMNKTVKKNEIPDLILKLWNAIDSMDSDDNKFPTVNNNTIKIAKELQDTSSLIKDMDSLILAQAIDDDEATHFYTEDKDLRNDLVWDYIEKLRRDGRRASGLDVSDDL